MLLTALAPGHDSKCRGGPCSTERPGGWGRITPPPTAGSIPRFARLLTLARSHFPTLEDSGLCPHP